MRRFALLVSLPILIFACAPRTETTETATVGTTGSAEAARQAVDQLRQRWIQGAERKDAAAVAALYAHDAVVTAPQEPPVRGRLEIERLWQTQFPMTSNLRIEPSKIEAGPEVVAEYGAFAQRVTPPEGTPQDHRGEYLVVTRRQDDGSWRIVMHMTFPRMGPGGAAPATGTTTGTTTAPTADPPASGTPAPRTTPTGTTGTTMTGTTTTGVTTTGTSPTTATTTTGTSATSTQ